MKTYFHKINAGMHVGEIGHAHTQRQLTADEHYLISLPPTPLKADDEEKARIAANEIGMLRNLANNCIAMHESQIPFNRAEIGMEALIIAGEFTDFVPNEYAPMAWWRNDIIRDLGSVILESIFMKFGAPQAGQLQPQSARFVATEGDKRRVVYVEGQALQDSMSKPHMIPREIYAAF